MIRSTYIFLRPILALTLGSIGCGTETNPSNPEYQDGSDLSIRNPLAKTITALIERAEVIVPTGHF
jgi:hypothetical protein